MTSIASCTHIMSLFLPMWWVKTLALKISKFHACFSLGFRGYQDIWNSPDPAPHTWIQRESPPSTYTLPPPPSRYGGRSIQRLTSTWHSRHESWQCPKPLQVLMTPPLTILPGPSCWRGLSPFPLSGNKLKHRARRNEGQITWGRCSNVGWLLMNT